MEKEKSRIKRYKYGNCKDEYISTLILGVTTRQWKMIKNSYSVIDHFPFCALIQNISLM